MQSNKSAVKNSAKVRAPMIAGLVIAAIAWINYGLYSLCNFNLMSSPHSVNITDPLQVKLYLGLAILITLGGLWYGWAQGKTNARLLSEGEAVVGRIERRAALRANGLRGCSISYEFNGQTLVHKPFRGLPPHLDTMNVGDPIELYVDPRKPSNVLVIWPKSS